MAGRSGDRQSVLYYLLASRHNRDTHKDQICLPRRLWMAWGTLKGCIDVRKTLQAEDDALYRKVMAHAVLRNGPLQNREDPTAFVESRLEKFLATNDNINELVSGRGTAMISFAIYTSNVELVRELIEQQGYDINISTMAVWEKDVASGEGGESPIMLAARTGNLEIFHYLLEGEADLRCELKYECNVLHSITWFPDAVAADLAPTLVAMGASLATVAQEHFPRGIYNPNTHVHIQGTPLRWAAHLGHRNLVECLTRLHCEQGETVPDFEDTVLHSARYFQADILGTLLDHYANLHPLSTPLSDDALDQMLAHAVMDPTNFHTLIALGEAAIQLQTQTIRKLLELGARSLRIGYVILTLLENSAVLIFRQ